MLPQVSLVVPAYNEASVLRANCLKLKDHMDRLGIAYEVLLVENGSDDGTAAEADALAEEHPEFRVIHLPEPSLGEALRAGIQNARADKVVYYPIDLSVSPSFIPGSLRMLDYFDVVAATKRLGGGDERSLGRRVLSAAYHGLVRLLYGTALTDTTCAKAFRRLSVSPLLRDLPGETRVFETELMVRAEARGLKILELPVAVQETRASPTGLPTRALLKLRDLLSLRLGVMCVSVGLFLLVAGGIYAGLFWLGFLRGGDMGGCGFTFQILVAGVQFLALGLLASLVLRAWSESARR